MTKQKSRVGEKFSPTRVRAAETPAAAAASPAEERPTAAEAAPAAAAVSPVEEKPAAAEAAPAVAAVSPAEEKPAAAEAAPAAAALSPAEEKQSATEAAPAAPATPEVVAASAHASAGVPAKTHLLAGEGKAIARDELLAFAWSNKNLEFWGENAEALCRLASELGAARTPGEVVEAQTKFATERLRAFGRHAEDFAKAPGKFFFAA